MSLAINNWWSFSGGTGDNHLIESCSNPAPGNCHSFCDDIVVIDVEFTTDDFDFVNIDGSNVQNKTSHDIQDPYCIADFRSNCAYQYWLVFKLVPIALHVAGFLMQLLTWWYYKDFTPQQKQYDVIIAHLYSEISTATAPGAAAATATATDTDTAADTGQQNTDVVNYPEMFRGLLEKPYASVFSLLEVMTVVYVWGELLYPPVYCGSARPLSLYYYPVGMSLLELTKFNFYASRQLYKQKRYDKAVFALLSIEMMGTTAWVTTCLALIFLIGVVYDCCLRVKWLLQLVLYKLCAERFPGMPEWPEMRNDEQSDSIKTTMTGIAVISIELNPMTCVENVPIVDIEKQ